MKFDAASGRLSPNTPGEIATKKGAGPRHLAFHPSGRFLYLITETTATIGAYAIDQKNGTLKELQFVDMLAGTPKEPPAAADLHVTPDGKFLYGSERRSNILVGFRIDPHKGTLTLAERCATETTPRGFGIEPARQVPARGRARFAQHDGLRDTPERLARPGQAARDGQEPELDRVRRSAIGRRSRVPGRDAGSIRSSARRKRFFRNTPSRDGSTRGGSSARIATRAKIVRSNRGRSAAKSRKPASSAMSNTASMPQDARDAGQADPEIGVARLHAGLGVAGIVEHDDRQVRRALDADRGERPQTHQHLAVAGHDQHAALAAARSRGQARPSRPRPSRPTDRNCGRRRRPRRRRRSSSRGR